MKKKDPDPGSGAFLTLGSETRENPYAGSAMNIPDNFSESLLKLFMIKNS
jgi:hypothetical protein